MRTRPSIFFAFLLASPACSQTLLDRARTIALNYSRTLPDFVCTQVVHRYIGWTRDWRLRDTLVLKLDFAGGKESYTLTSVDGQPAASDYKDAGGAVTTGEFGTLLRRLFEPESHTEFSRVRTAKVHGQRVTVYRFEVPLSGAHHNLTYKPSDLPPITVRVPDHGQLFIDDRSANVLRVESEAGHIPADFPIHASSTTLEYDFAAIGGRQYLLPLHARIELRTGRSRTRNDVDFVDYRKFSTDTSITFVDPPNKDK